MDNENIFKNLDFNKTKQILKETIDKSGNSDDLLWILLFMICLSFGTEKMDEVLKAFLEEHPDLKEKIERCNINN